LRQAGERELLGGEKREYVLELPSGAVDA